MRDLRQWFLLLIFWTGAASLPAHAQQEAEIIFDLVIDRMEAGRDELARELLDELDPEQLDPASRSVAHYLSAVINMNQGQMDRALADFESAEESGFTSPQMDYRIGLAHLELGNAEPAMRHLSAYIDSNPDNAFAHYHLGRAQLLAGDTAGARQSITTAAELAPDNDLFLLYLARLVHDEGDYKVSGNLLDFISRNEQASASDLAIALRSGAENTTTPEKPVSGWVSFGISHDDNVIGLADGAPTPAGIDDEGDSVLDFGLGVDWRVYDQGGQLFQLGYRYFLSNYSDLDQFDSTEHMLQGSYSRWFSDALLAGAIISYSTMELDNEDFLDRWVAQFSVRKQLDEAARLGGFYTYSDNDYTSPVLVGARDRDGSSHVLGGYYSREFIDWQTFYSLAVEENNTDGGDFQSTGISLNLSASRHLLDMAVAGSTIPLNFAAILGFSTYDYDEANSIGGQERSDDVWEAALSLSAEIRENLGVSLTFSHLDNSSNIGFYNYDRNQVSATVIATF